MKQNEKIERINFLQKEISELSYFVTTLNECSEVAIHSASIITEKTEVKKTYSIFGYRWFGIGKHEKTINVPSTMVFDIALLAFDRQKKYEQELNELLK